MCYEKRPKYLGAFTPAYKTYIMYFIKLLKLLLLSSPCHRESSTDRKVSEKPSLSGATDAVRSKGDPARTEVTSPGCCHLSLWAAVPGDARLGSWSSPHPTDTHWGQHNLGEPTPAPRTNPSASGSLAVTSSTTGQTQPFLWPGARGEDWGRRGALSQGKVPTNPCGKGRDTADLLGVQPRRQHHQAFSTTPLFWFVPFLTQFIVQAWLSPI